MVSKLKAFAENKRNGGIKKNVNCRAHMWLLLDTNSGPRPCRASALPLNYPNMLILKCNITNTNSFERWLNKLSRHGKKVPKEKGK